MPEFSARPFAAESARCREARTAWAGLTVGERLRPVRAFRHLLAARADDLADAAHADVNRDRGEFVGTDLLPTAAAAKFLERRAARILKPTRAESPPLWLWGCRDTIHRRPFGLVGVIGTWNYPVYLNAIPIVQAVTAGNGVLWKPSELAPRTASLLTELFADAGFPEGLIVTLPATREAGPRLAEADVDFVHFTGSDDVGRKLAARLGERLIPSTLELSGTDACFVLDDADVAFAAKAVWFGTTLNAGQTCLAVRRVFVARPAYELFVAALTPFAESGKAVALVLPSQVEFLAAAVAEAQGQSCRVLKSGSPFLSGKGVRGLGGLEDNLTPRPPSLRGKGEQIPEGKGVSVPTFLLDAPPTLSVFDTICFAPVAAVTPFDSLDEAVRIHESGRFGLSASVFTNDPKRGTDLAARLSTGGVIVNDVIAPTAHPGTPFGGRKASGWGTTQGAEGLLSFTVPHVVTVRSGRFRPHLDGHATGDPAVPEITRGLLALTHAKGLGARWRGLVRVVKGMARYGKEKSGTASKSVGG